MTEDRIIGAARAIAEALGQDYDVLPDFHLEPHRFCRDDFRRAALSAQSTGSAEPVADWLAEQKREAREQARKAGQEFRLYAYERHAGQAEAYEAAHAYVVVRPTPPAGGGEDIADAP